MPFKAQNGLVRRHSATVVNDLNQGPSGILDHHGNLVGSGIHGILHQLLHHRSRSLNDLSGSNHICYITR